MASNDAKEPEFDRKLLRRVLIGVLTAAVLFITFFGFRTITSFVYWNDEAHQSQPIAGWMTPRYVGKSWRVPPEVVAAALQIELSAGTGRTSLEQIANARGEDLTTLIATLDAAISTHKATQP